VPDVVEKLVKFYLNERDSEVERFIDLVHRIGIEPFKTAVYGNPDQRAARRREPALA
jgi:sulfite reductase (NADPH) hemoprotein beta-component